MGDYSNFSIAVHGVSDPRVITAIKNRIDEYQGGAYEEEITEHSLSLGLNDVHVGAVEEVNCWLTILVAIGLVIDETTVPVSDFYWWVNDEPAYEWLGTLRVHSPGVGDFEGICDADGSPLVNASALERMVEQATDLATLQEDVRKATGVAIIAAYREAAIAAHANG